MTETDRRSAAREETLNLLEYVVRGRDGKKLAEGMGRTLNVSETGLLLETHVPLLIGQEITLTIGLGDDLVQVRGEVTRADPGRESRFCSGIEFGEVPPRALATLRRYIDAHRGVGLGG